MSVAMLIVFIVGRVILCLMISDRIASIKDLMNIFLFGFRIDLSSLGWILSILFTCTILSSLTIFSWKLYRYLYIVLMSFFVTFSFFMEASTPDFITEYGVRPNRFFVEYLVYPKEVLKMLCQGRALQLVIGLIIVVLVFLGALRIFGKIVKKEYKINKLVTILLLPVILAVTVFMARSTLGHRPINPAMVAFSTDPTINEAVLNSSYSVAFAATRMKYSESFFESADNPENFLITFQGNDGKNYDTYFNSGSYSYKYIADINGIYAKFGVIALPYEGLRVGASIQSPTAYTISESWQYSASTTYADSYYNDNQTSPAGDYSYCLRSPYLASLGVAYTFEGYGFISADYELADYSVMKFSDVHSDEMSSDPYLKINEANRNFAGLAHSLRLGAEVKVNPEFSVRAGYSLVTSPEHHWTNNSGDDVDASSFISSFNDYYSGNKSLVTYSYYGDRTTSYSFGFGYSSPGSFFADIAARVINYPHSTFSPYYDYVNYDSTGNEVNVKSPKVLNSRSLWNVALTLGWRF